MKTSKILFKIAIYLLAGIALTVILPFTVWAILNDSDLADTLESNWNIMLSDESGWKEIYHADSGASFHGDGWRYHIVTYENEDAISDMVNWSVEEGNVWNKTYPELMEEWIRYTDAESDMHPVYDSCMYWYQAGERNHSEIIMCWNAERKTIYIAEFFQ